MRTTELPPVAEDFHDGKPPGVTDSGQQQIETTNYSSAETHQKDIQNSQMAELCMAAANGSIDAFDAVFMSHYAGLREDAYYILPRHMKDLAPDIVHIVYVKARENLSTFELPAAASMTGWLRRITHNAAVDYCRVGDARFAKSFGLLASDGDYDAVKAFETVDRIRINRHNSDSFAVLDAQNVARAALEKVLNMVKDRDETIQKVVFTVLILEYTVREATEEYGGEYDTNRGVVQRVRQKLRAESSTNSEPTDDKTFL